ncbi:immunoglobulin kappa light chain-like [Halichoeres trimaculatus]|uniref:immunoglobulin kappa light chain-like n=1 Tax=Halichoeres trimaculatus TaxID=147232 RepID=UPI003D9E40AA
MSPLMLRLCLTCLCLKTMAQAAWQQLSSAVHQESGFVSADVGGKITLRCFYEGDVATKFYWYKQTLGEKPKLVSSYFRYAESKLFHGEFKNNPRFTLDTNTGRNHLKITDLRVSDTATYYCGYWNSGVLEFLEGIFLSVRGSGLDFEILVHQSGSETIQPGASVTLSCTVHTGSCDGEQSVYWFKHSEESQPGLIYIHGDENDQCLRKPNQQSCEFILPMQSLNLSHVGIYYCAVVSCGHILFGNGTRISFKDEGDLSVMLYVLSGALTFTAFLVVLLAVGLCVIIKRNNFKHESNSTTNQQVDLNEENIHYASVREHRLNKARRQSNNPKAECVYSGIKQ